GLSRLLQQTPSLKRAGNGPSLGGGASRTMRRISIENFAERAHSLVFQRVGDALQQGLRARGVAADAVRGEAEGGEEPGPNGALVIAAVALEDAAAVTRMILRAFRRERAQSESGEEMAPTDLHDVRLIFRGERT